MSSQIRILAANDRLAVNSALPQRRDTRARAKIMHEYTFDRNNVRTVFFDNAADRFEYLPESVRELAVHTLNRSTGDVLHFVPVKINDAETRQARARIDTEYASFFCQISLRFLQVRLH